MKKYFEVRPSFSDLKEKIVVLQDRDEKKTMVHRAGSRCGCTGSGYTWRCLSAENKNG